MHTARHHILSVLVTSCVTAALLAGCGDDSADTQPAQPPAAPSSKPSSSAEPAVEASTLPVPSGGPTTIKDFPIPGGADIVDIGPAGNKSWTFGIGAPDPATVLSFYKKALTEQGYTIREDAAVTVGANRVEYDLAFFGKTYGVVDESDLAGGTQVTVNDRPISGLEP